MNNILIISIYDNGYEFSICYNNKCYDYESGNVLCKKIYHEYNNKEYINAPYSTFEEYLKTLNFDEIYVCENGDIVKVK